MAKKSNDGLRKHSPNYKANNEGGYGNPPVRSQFKEGGKGGPGRPKGKASLTAALSKVYNENISLGDGTSISTTEALARRSRQKGLTGSWRDLERSFELAEKYGPEGTSAPLDLRPFVEAMSVGERNMLGFVVGVVTGAPLKLEASGENAHELLPALGTYKVFVRESGLIGVEKIADGRLDELAIDRSD